MRKASSAWRRLAQLHKAAAALLVEAAEAWVMLLECRKRAQRLRKTAEEALRDGDAQQRVALARGCRQQRCARLQHCGELALPQQYPQPRYLGSRRGGGSRGVCGIHGRKREKKGGPFGPPLILPQPAGAGRPCPAAQNL